MTANQGQNKKGKHNRSFLVTWITRLVSFFSALFLGSFIGRAIMNSGDTFENSFIRKACISKMRSLKKENSFLKKISQVLENGLVARVCRAAVSLITTMSVSVYGMFLASFGICSVIVHFIAIYVISNPVYNDDIRLIVGIILTVCSIPFLSSSKSVIQLFSSGKTAKKLTVGFFCIPEEKLRNQKKCGGVALMLLSTVVGIACGVLSYFISPISILIALGVLIAAILILNYPEIGIILSCILMPFLQYVGHPDMVMFVLVVLTAFSYGIKLLRGKRTFHISDAGVMVILFGITMIIAGIFSSGGEGAFVHSIYNVVIIFGAFFIGGNLTRNDKVRRVCVKILMASLVAIAFLQFFNLYYIQISAGVENSLQTDYRSIVDNTGLGAASDLKIPGLWAAMISPLLIAECFKRKKICGVVGLLLCFVPVVLSIAYFGTFEIMIALLIGVALYLILHSSRSVTNIIIISLCAALIFTLVPIIVGQLGVDNIPALSELIEEVFPDSHELSSYRSHVVDDTWRMLKDGNLLGIGSGTETYRNALAPYVTLASRDAELPGTAYMQILCEAGVLGLLIFVAFSVFLLKNGLKYVMRPKDRDFKIHLLGLLSGFITALILGLVSCIFEDVQMRYLFWLCAGIISSQIYSGEANESFSRSTMKDTADEVDVVERI